ncbi:MAG: TlpA disulfide reductase family protein [Ilumatobacter fluminis]|uniref:TlpA family protein disulfide reductase n=1 Tax=Ilumatobacter fluminis TaxID=467091 RepID=UPI0032ED67F0
MTGRPRDRALAIVAGSVVAVAVVVAGFWLGGAFEPSQRTDGSFVLDEPGIFQQPFDDVNDDTSGEQLPDVVLIDADGVERSLDEVSDRPAIVNLWFSRCIPCRRELVDFAEVHAEYGDRIAFVGIDPFDTPEAMVEFATERGVEYELWRDPDQEFVDAIGIVGFPVTLFVDADGTVVRQTGEIDAAGLRSAIAELFPDVG